MRNVTRRQLLGGAGAGLLLAPFLNTGMQKQALAAGSSVKRLVLFCTMGTYPSAWTPTGISGEAISQFSAMTKPLEAIKDSIVLVEGMPSGNPNDGHGAPDGITGMGYGYYNGQLKISVDQFIANQLVAQGINRPISSLLVGGATNGGGGVTMFYGGASNGGNNLPTIGSPLSAYSTVFGGALPTGMSADSLLARRKSILDLVSAEATSLKGQLGSMEAAKLDTHLDSIRQLENKLTATMSTGAACMKPTAPGADSTYQFQGDADALAMNKVHLSLIANAFACDITRVAAIQYGNDQSLKVNAPNLPYDDQHGGFIHSGAASNFKNLIAFEAYLAGEFVSLVNQLKAFKDPEDSSKTLFDTTLVAWCRDMGDAVNHDQKSMRFVLAGGTGYLKTSAQGRYVKSTERHERILLNMCEAMGVSNFKGFGDPDLPSKSPLPGIAAT